MSLQAGGSILCRPSSAATLLVITFDKEQVHVFARIHLSVCLLARLLKNACIDLHEMLRVVVSTDGQLINFSVRPAL